MDCRQARELIRCERRFADGLSQPDASAVAGHVAACPACRAERAREAAFDAAVRPAMQEVAVPDDLAARILWELRRHRRSRQRARVLFTSVASAAALFVAVSLGWYQNRPYDLASLHEAVEWVDQGQPVARFDPGATPTPAALQSWLSRNGVSTPVPARLRIRHLAGACIVNVSGRKVALLELRDVTSLTRVFLLERRYFSEGLRQQLYHRDNVVSYVVADDAESSSLGWMIVDQGTPNQFVDGDMPDSGL